MVRSHTLPFIQCRFVYVLLGYMIVKRFTDPLSHSIYESSTTKSTRHLDQVLLRIPFLVSNRSFECKMEFAIKTYSLSILLTCICGFGR